MWITTIMIFLLSLVAMIAFIIVAASIPALVEFLEENSPRFMNWVVRPLACGLFFLVTLAEVGSCYLENWGPEDAVETVDCNAPDIQCINADEDDR